MLRRVLALAGGTALACAAALSIATPAHAATQDAVVSPLSIGDYCHQKVASWSWIGFYKLHGLACYGGYNGDQYAGGIYPEAVCAFHYPNRVLVTTLRGPSESLICRLTV
ncbi:hypothetical protein [Streptosporangium saharense]|uniref:hypothetical protein n=1 Tax=Streptosporangium saharense TaxID=1706840 RepID=UPI0036AF2F77